MPAKIVKINYEGFSKNGALAGSAASAGASAAFSKDGKASLVATVIGAGIVGVLSADGCEIAVDAEGQRLLLSAPRKACKTSKEGEKVVLDKITKTELVDGKEVKRKVTYTYPR